MLGVPAVRFRFTLSDDEALPPDAADLGLRPERVRAFGLAEALAADDAGTVFERFIVTDTPDRGDEASARVFGAVVVPAPLRSARWPAAKDAAGIASTTTSPALIVALFMSVSLLAVRPDAHSWSRRERDRAQGTWVTSAKDGCPPSDEGGVDAASDAVGHVRRRAGRRLDPR
jgi:hypothetical protein